MSNKATQVFILGTGRSGTKTMANVLTSNEGCSVLHEPSPSLQHEVMQYMLGRLPKEDMIQLLGETRAPVGSTRQRIYGESNQRLSFVLPELQVAFPNAKYIWVIRDGRDVVASTCYRGWYTRNESNYHHGRLTNFASSRMRADLPLVGEMTSQQWSSQSVFAKNCWYWSYANRLICKQISALKLDAFTLRLEDISKRLPELMNFLGLPTTERTEVPRSNAAKQRAFRPLYPSKPVSVEYWSGREHEVFSQLCGSLMDQHYDGWRTQKTASLQNRLKITTYRAARDSYVASYDWVHTRVARAARQIVQKRNKAAA